MYFSVELITCCITPATASGHEMRLAATHPSMMQATPQVKVANLTWDHKYDEAKSESSYETDNFYVGFGFSDQCYLVRTVRFSRADLWRAQRRI